MAKTSDIRFLLALSWKVAHELPVTSKKADATLWFLLALAGAGVVAIPVVINDRSPLAHWGESSTPSLHLYWAVSGVLLLALTGGLYFVTRMMDCAAMRLADKNADGSSVWLRVGTGAVLTVVPSWATLSWTPEDTIGIFGSVLLILALAGKDQVRALLCAATRALRQQAATCWADTKGLLVDLAAQAPSIGW